ncbi:MAG: hypothetical protein DRP09_03840 [Candidatus Thorarchaeota archaeon]|nr:MAG: hypothetical protein DRP09_03840 [Candidatus Thorarchaeota archaeon]
MSLREQNLQKIAENYSKYLNGPLGRAVIDDLDEGETCMIRSEGKTFKITKTGGVAKVRILRYETEK